MAFGVLALSQVFHAYNMRSEKSLFRIKVFGNSKLNLAFIVSALLVAAVLFIEPISYIFGLARMKAVHYLVMLLLAVIPIPVMEIYKLVSSKLKRK